MKMKIIIAAVATFLVSANTWALDDTASSTERLVEVQYLMRPEYKEVLLVFPEETHYFNNDATRLCYAFKIPGRWKLGKEPGLLQSEDGRALAGVLLYSAQELRGFEGPDLITRASKRLTEVYKKNSETTFASTNLEPFKSSRSGTKKWSFVTYFEQAGEQYELRDSKVFAEIVPGWVAQVTASRPSFDESLALTILETLGSSSEPECYWPLIRRYFPDMPTPSE